MTHSRISPDDPKLTAYALGELPPAECAVVEAALADDAEARAAVEEIRAFAGQLEAALANEPEAACDVARSGEPVERSNGGSDQRIHGSTDQREERARRPLPRPACGRQASLPGRRPGKVLRFPQVAWIGGTLAAACVAVLVALHPPVGRTSLPAVALREGRVPGEHASPNAKRTHARQGGGTPPTTQAKDMRGGDTPPTAQAGPADGLTPSAGRAATAVAVAGVADPGRPGSTSPATPGRRQPEFQFAENSAAPAFAANYPPVLKAVDAPLLQQVKPSGAVDLNPVARPSFGYNGGTLAVEETQRTAGLGSRSVEPRKRNLGFFSLSVAPVRGDGAGAVARTWGTSTARATAQREARSRGAAMRAPRFAGQRPTAAEAPTYYYPPDDRFVVPVEPRVASPFVVPAPPPPVNGEVWETVPKPQPPWGAAHGPRSFGYIEAPKPFAFQVPQDWDNTIAKHPYLPPGPFDLLPGRRLEVRRFPLVRPLAAAGETESYAYLHDNRFVAPADAPFSTFSVDVDTASYANVRRFIDGGRLPPPDAVRIEELVNHFPYHYPAPAATAAAAPLAASLEVADAPWAPTHRLVRIGLKAREAVAGHRPVANLVFLLDVSGSMRTPNKLPLVKDAMRTLVDALHPDDRVAIVTYAGSSGLALPSTPASQGREILDALDALTANGSTNGGMGIQLAYDIAKANFMPGGINRVILCTDGDFNVGVTNEGDLVRLIADKAKSGVMLTVLGFGMGNYKDSTLELLADKGNGNYGYVDSRAEATKLLRDQVDGTLNTVAKDVKVQVDFNPARVARYRLIGYEDRALNAQDFNDDAVDAGEIGAGQTVTALYEIVPVGVEDRSAPGIDRSRYAAASAAPANAGAHVNELLTVKVRYKQPAGDVSQKLEFPLVDRGAGFANASADFKFAAAVAEFGMILRHSPYRGDATMGDLIASAAAGSANADDDPQAYRKQFVELALKAERIMQEPQSR